MSVDDLRRHAPPPPAPVDPGTAELWRGVEARLGVQLPSDYKQLIDTYGTGRFANFLTLFTPFATDGYVNLLAQDQLALHAYKALRDSAPELTPFPAYPEPGGLLPWAQSDNGDVAYWLTEGPADSWPVILIESRHGEIERYELAATEFLQRMLTNALPSHILPLPLSQATSAPFTALPSS